MTYREEFPGFDPATMPVIPQGWEDISWHNDACPSFEVAPNMRVWIDYADPDQREEPDGPRFILNYEHPDGAIEPLIGSDDWNEILAFLYDDQVHGKARQ